MHTEDSSEQSTAPEPILKVERHGIDTIPASDRTSTWVDLLRIQFGGANTFSTILLGTIPILLGLSFLQAVVAIVGGLLVGILFLAPMGLFGPKTGTNNAVSSGAFFGVRGRIVGSFLSLLTAVAFYSISVWVSGDAIAGALYRLFAIEDSIALRTAIYSVIGILVIVVVVYGYQFMLFVSKVAVIVNTILILLAFAAFAGAFDVSYDPGPSALALGGFWPTFVLAALISMATPVSFGAFLGDWSRYIPGETPARKLVAATVFGQLLTLIPLIFGAATATLVAGEADFVFALVQVSPIWYAVLLIAVAFIGGMATGTTSLYGTGLDFSSVFPRLSRVGATIIISALAFTFIVTGRVFFDLLGAVNAFIGAIIVTTVPWMIIMSLGYFLRRGWFHPDDLQVFNRGARGGRYWFTNGTNYRGLIAWLAAAGLGLMFANYPPVIQGPLAGIAGGVDISLLVAIVAAAVLYLIGIFAFPEPEYVYGPLGGRMAPARTVTVPPVTAELTSGGQSRRDTRESEA